MGRSREGDRGKKGEERSKNTRKRKGWKDRATREGRGRKLCSLQSSRTIPKNLVLLVWTPCMDLPLECGPVSEYDDITPVVMLHCVAKRRNI